MNNIQFINLNKCPICDSTHLALHAKLDNLTPPLSYQKCLDCTLVFMNPQISQSSLEDVFSSETYWKGELCYADYSLLEKLSYKNAQLRLKYLSNHIKSPAEILEIGCSSGLFLLACQQNGHHTTGLEISDYQINKSAESSVDQSLEIIHSNLEDYITSHPRKTFNAICLWGIEGNFPNLKEVFSQIHSILEQDGILALNWMNFNHWLRPILFGRFRQGLTSLTNLTPMSYRKLLEVTSFREHFTTSDLQYSNLEKFCALSGRHFVLNIARKLHISEITIPIPTILGKISFLKKA